MFGNRFKQKKQYAHLNQIHLYYRVPLFWVIAVLLHCKTSMLRQPLCLMKVF